MGAMSDTQPHLVDLDAQHTAVVVGRVPMSEIADFFDRSFGLIASTLAAAGVTVSGPAFAKYRTAPTDVADLEVGFPVAEPIAATGDVTPSTLPGGQAATLVHAGGYDALGDSWSRLFAWAVETKFLPAGPFWEVYVTEPSPDMDPADLRTDLYLPGLTLSG